MQHCPVHRGATKLAAKGGVKVPENYVYPHPDMCTIRHEDLSVMQDSDWIVGVTPPLYSARVALAGSFLGYLRRILSRPSSLMCASK